MRSGIKLISGLLLLAGALAAGLMLPKIGMGQAGTASTSTISGLSREELERQVEAKAKELEQINQQLETTQQSLRTTQQERAGLQRELNTLQGNINQLNLSIKADEITIQKLGLEIESLSYDIRDIETSSLDKQEAIGRVLNELQKLDQTGDNLLVLFLKNDSLAEGVFAVQALRDLHLRLASDVRDLDELHAEYTRKISLAGEKKTNIDYHSQNLKNRKLIVEDQRGERSTLLQQTRSRESAFEQQVSELRKLQQQIADEVEAVSAILRTKIDPSTLPAPGSGVLAIPVLGSGRGAITQDYGATAFAQYGYRGKRHNGVDIGAPLGTPVVAAEEGTIVAVGNQDSYCYRGAYGRFVVIEHQNNLTTLYAHLSRQTVSKGDTVKRGGVIGYVGRTGYATGPHLHFTVFAKPTFYMGPSKSCGPMPLGGDLNPSSYL
ncbi:hypothetical protein C4587_00470 [Candidatus Parcubacteria bacterium]|nr:MAG: hypothetical protein C4587_00470 [Candidatus Parcubacteria bacterium]